MHSRFASVVPTARLARLRGLISLQTNWGANGSEDLPAFEAELDVTRETVVHEAAESCQENSLIDFGERRLVHTGNSSRRFELILFPTM
jgi:hypothetical protein